MSLKLAYLSPSTLFSGKANAVHVMKMCQAFATNTIETTLFIQCEKPFSKKDALDFYDVDDNFNIEIISSIKIPKIKSLWLGYKSALQAKKQSHDIAYSRLISGAFFSCLMGLKSVLEIHSKPNFYESALLKYIVHSNNLLAIVVISQPLKEIVIEAYGVSSDKIFVHHDGADIKTSNLTNPYNSTQPNIAYIGSLYHGRGVNVIEGIARLNSEYKFHIVGENSSVEHRNYPDNMHFYGALPFQETETYRKHADILIAPYQSSVKTGSGDDTTQWMSPLKIFEYMASGTPFICSNLSALRDIVTHEENCLMCPADDCESWAKSIDRLIKDKETAKKLSQNAYKKLSSQYTWTIRAKNILQNVRQLL